MAEQEVIKHTKAVYKIWNSKSHDFWHKLKEFFIEIFIIVFAVTLSIWFHSWSEHKHEQQDVKEFLIGLRQDLQHDMLEMKSDEISYVMQGKIFTYLVKLKMNEKVNEDTINNYREFILNTTGLNPNNGRFEGFKSSGKITNIEDKFLQNSILDLYQEDIPVLLSSTNGYIERKKRLDEFIIKNRKRLTDSTSNFNEILVIDECRNINRALANTEEILNRYENCIKKMELIITKINEEYRSVKEGK